MVSPNLLKIRGPDEKSRQTDNIDAVLRPVAQALVVTPIMGAPPPPWIQPSLAAGWATSLAPLALPAYHKDCLGYVHLQGVVTDTTGAPNAGLILTLPMGYRPKQLHLIPGGAATYTVLLLSPDGTLVPATGLPIAANSFVSFDFIFLPEASGASFNASAGGGSSGGGVRPAP